MTDAREVLAEIQQRADNDYWDNTTSARLAFDDRDALVAALTAVLDLHKPYDYPALGVDIPGVPERILCGGDHGDDLGTEYPCDTVRAITEALL